MKRSEVIFKDYFCGNRISDYGREHGRVDYATLAKAFDAVLNNNIMSATGWEYWEQESGFVDNSEEIEAIEDEAREIEEQLELGGLSICIEKRTQLEERLEEIENEVYELEAEQDEQPEIFQYFIISDQGAEILEDYTNEIVFYNRELDMYVWGVTHWGTSWDYVLTDIRCEKETKTA